MKLYIHFLPQTKEFIYSGIKFIEFNKYLPHPLNNLILLKGDFLGNRYEHHFELLEGKECIEILSKENIYDYGDFCFVDYVDSNAISKLTNEQIAELLYMAHTHVPLECPFLNSIKNQFVYLAHDDGFYCKLYSYNPNDFATIIFRKIEAIAYKKYKKDIIEPTESIKNKFLDLCTTGILLDLDEIFYSNIDFRIKLYSMGIHSNIDYILNNQKALKQKAISINELVYRFNEWMIY